MSLLLVKNIMIGKLTGKISSSTEESIIIDVHGVGYLVYMSSPSIQYLADKEEISLFIETHVREDNITLFGFLSESDKTMFNLLKTVQGVGPKLALSIIALDSNFILNAIMLQEPKKLQTVPGVGAKMAARIVNELPDKVVKLFANNSFTQPTIVSSRSTNNDIISEAIAALKSLGYKDKEAEKAVNYVISHNATDNMSIEQIVKEALGYFSGN